MLKNALVLIAEDQAIIALELAFAIADAGGEVAGPVTSVEAALAMIEERPITAAILDFNLSDGDIVPVLAALLQSNIPVIIQSGVGLTPQLSQRFPDLIVYTKPSNSSDIVRELSSLVADR